jgi:tetratricopeptide (TPR) repeat protein
VRFGRCVFPILVAGLLLAPVALADSKTLDPAKEAKRTTLFEEGRALHLEGRHAEAVVKLKEVVEMRKSPQALRALGLAEQAAGKLLDARAHFDEALRLAQDSGPASEVDPAKSALVQVATLVPRIHIVIPKGTEDPKIVVDGAPAAPKDDAVDVDPGTHTVSVEAKGVRPFTHEVKVKAGAVVDVAVEFEKGGGGGAGHEVRSSVRRPIGLGIAALGGAGLVAGAVTGVLAITTHDDLAGHCAKQLCPEDQLSKLDTYHALGTASTVLFIAGGVVAAGGAVIWITAPRPSATVRAHATPFIGPGTAGVRVTF